MLRIEKKHTTPPSGSVIVCDNIARAIGVETCENVLKRGQFREMLSQILSCRREEATGGALLVQYEEQGVLGCSYSLEVFVHFDFVTSD